MQIDEVTEMFYEFWFWFLFITCILISIPLVYTYWLSENKIVSVKIPNVYGVIYFGTLIISLFLYSWYIALIFLAISVLIGGVIGHKLFKWYIKRPKELWKF